jgi:acyl carrier protein
MTEKVISCIEEALGREISDDAKNSTVTLYQAGVTSYELVEIIVKFEETFETDMDDVLDKVNDLTINDFKNILEKVL